MNQPASGLECPSCHTRNAPDAAQCHACRARLIVSLIVCRPAPLEQVGRFADRLAAGDLARARLLEQRLSCGRGVLLRQVPLVEAERLRSEGTALGIALELRHFLVLPGEPDDLPVVRRAERVAPAVLAALFLLIASAGVFLYFVLQAPPGDAGAGWRSATVRAGRIAPWLDPLHLPERPALPDRETPITDVLVERIEQAVARVQLPRSVGTGFFVREDGLLVTNYHVVADGGPIRVSLGEEEALARVVRLAPAWDLALLQTELRPNEVLELADGARAAPRTPVMTVGSAEGMDGSVREGRITFVGRTIDAIALLELDMAVSQGNSGGPVVDGRGRVVGIINASLGRSDRTSYAILSNYLFDGIDALLRDYIATFPVSAAFLKLQLRSLAEIGPRVQERLARSSDQAFVTSEGVLALVAECGQNAPPPHGKEVEVEVRIRTEDHRVLLDRIELAGTSGGEQARGGPATERCALYVSFPLEPEVYERMRASPRALVEVRNRALDVQRILKLTSK